MLQYHNDLNVLSYFLPASLYLLCRSNIIRSGNYAGLIMAATKQLGTNSNNSNGYIGASE